MKIIKIAQVPVPQQTGQAITEALDPRMATMLRQSLVGSGLTKQKVLPFLEQLFTALGDVQISKVKQLISALQEEPVQQQSSVQTPPVQAPVQTAVPTPSNIVQPQP